MSGDLTTADVPLGDGRVLRIGLSETDLILAIGDGEGPSWREDPAEGLTLPASALGPLVETLTRLNLPERRA